NATVPIRVLRIVRRLKRTKDLKR
ncbi:hypothetical protein MPH_13341, partial [Macrophomina phaseolina MS6]